MLTALIVYAALQRSTLLYETSGYGTSYRPCWPGDRRPRRRRRTRTDMTLRFREGEGFVLVYSITARATFERIERFRHQITRVKDSDSIPIVLVGNKSDRANEREVGKEEGAALAKRLGCEFVETSAKTRSNLEHAYYSVVRLSESTSRRRRSGGGSVVGPQES